MTLGYVNMHTRELVIEGFRGTALTARRHAALAG